MCFAPQRRALFWQHNLQEWCKTVSFLHFWLGNVLRATTACTFSTSEHQKVVRTFRVLYIWTWKCASRHNRVRFFGISTSKSGLSMVCLCILTWKCASRHNGVQLFISHLARWLRTRRFSEVTFRPSRAPNHWKNTVNRDFPTFSRTCIFLLLTLSLLWSSHFLSSPPWLFPPLLFHLSILSEVWLLNFLWSPSWGLDFFCNLNIFCNHGESWGIWAFTKGNCINIIPMVQLLLILPPWWVI